MLSKEDGQALYVDMTELRDKLCASQALAAKDAVLHENAWRFIAPYDVDILRKLVAQCEENAPSMFCADLSRNVKPMHLRR